MMRPYFSSWKFLFLVLYGSVSLSAQDEPRLFTPYVNGIQTYQEDSKVVILWKDTVDLDGAVYLVYRHTGEISKSNLQASTLIATVPSGVSWAQDPLQESGDYWYAVLAKDTSGKTWDNLVPYRNKTVSPQKFILPSAVKVTNVVTNFQGRVDGTKVKFSFLITPPESNWLLFRSLEKPKNRQDLETSPLLGTISGSISVYEDTPPPGLKYWYSLVDAAAFAADLPGILSSANVTPSPLGIELTAPAVTPAVATPVPETAASATEPPATPVPAPGSPTVATPTPPPRSAPLLPNFENQGPASRPSPLPRLTLRSGSAAGATTSYIPLPPAGGSLDPVTAKTLTGLSKGRPKIPTPLPGLKVLPAEGSSTTLTGSDLELAVLVRTYFVTGKWSEAEKTIQQFLLRETDGKRKARALFYMAQAQVMQEKGRQALLSFLSASPLIPQAGIWRDRLLESGTLDAPLAPLVPPGIQGIPEK